MPSTHFLRHSLSKIKHFSNIAFLFTKSDLKTVVLPVTVFSAVSKINSATYSHRHMGISILWTWIHLLHFCISNQVSSIAEDAANKPWRPIPSGRIKPSQASIIQWFLGSFCVLISLYWNVSYASTVLLLATWIYNDRGLHNHWLGKNSLTSVGYVSFNLGAAMISNSQKSHDIALHTTKSFLMGLVVLTTAHAGDFADIVGDQRMKRQTLPLSYPNMARVSLAGGLTVWSIYGWYWYGRHSNLWLFFPLFGIILAWRFWAFRFPRDDQTSANMYQASKYDVAAGFHAALTYGLDVARCYAFASCLF
ncbi:UbiA prenyltransferase family-domain-containing protein [Infundibulicybe gibba]|nr:UbiA prenyltransferase family-domain-containing protein [Infundibulicybe gibba]